MDYKNILSSSTAILPEMAFTGLILILIAVVAFQTKPSRFNTFFTTCSLVIYGALLIWQQENLQIDLAGQPLFDGMLYIDKASLFFKMLCILAGLIFTLHSRLFDYAFEGEIYLLVLFNILGLGFLTMTTHLMVVFICIELVSISSYLLVVSKKSILSFEAGIKYFVVGGVVAATFLYSVSLVYGITHELNFANPDFAASLLKQDKAAISLLAFFVIGILLFKTGAAPFHIWIADVYQNTSTPILSYLAFAPKAAALLLLSRWLYFVKIDLEIILGIIILLSITIGNFTALGQTHLKRLLGYSGIAQMGFMLIGCLNAEHNGFYSSYYYVFNYLPIVMGAFFLVDVIYKEKNSYLITDMSGLAKSNPILGINAILIMISLVGLPPTCGFLAKLNIFGSLLNQPNPSGFMVFIFVFGLLNTAISLYYYLKLPYFMYFKIGEPSQKGIFQTLVLAYFSLIIIYLFFAPDIISQTIQSFLFSNI